MLSIFDTVLKQFTFRGLCKAALKSRFNDWWDVNERTNKKPYYFKQCNFLKFVLHPKKTQYQLIPATNPETHTCFSAVVGGNPQQNGDLPAKYYFRFISLVGYTLILILYSYGIATSQSFRWVRQFLHSRFPAGFGTQQMQLGAKIPMEPLQPTQQYIYFVKETPGPVQI